MKIFKSFLLYAGILLGLCVAVILCCLVAMLLFKAEIFGYKYVSYKSVKAPDDISASSVSAIEIQVSDMDVVVIPTNDNVIKVSYTEAMYGFVKSEVSEFKCSTEIDTSKEFAESENIYKTYVVSFTEPSGWILSNDSKVTVSVPYNKLSVVSIKSQKGDIKFDYNQDKNDESFNINTIYAQSQKGKIELLNVTTTNTYLTTTSGEVSIDSINDIEMKQVKFTSDSGKLTFVDKLNGGLKVVSNATTTGPYIIAKTINGDLYYNGLRGKVEIEQVGVEGSNHYVVLESDYLTANINKIYGKITTAKKSSNTNDFSISLKVNEVYVKDPNINLAHEISVGNGDLEIGIIDYTTSVISNNGNIKLNNVKITNGNVDITAGENSNVVINFDETINPSSGSKFVASIKSGNLTATNVKMLTNITANSERTGNINVVFVDVRANGENNHNANVINAGVHNVDLKIKNGLSYRLLVDQPAGDTLEIGPLGTATDILETDNDYVKDEAYKRQLRVNYVMDNFINVGNLKVVGDGGTIKINGIS